MANVQSKTAFGSEDSDINKIKYEREKIQDSLDNNMYSQDSVESKISNIKSIKKFWAIILISLFLIVSDNVYMLALQDPDSMTAVVSTIRRGGTIIPFLYGILILREPNAGKKIACLTGVAIGLLCLALGSMR